MGQRQNQVEIVYGNDCPWCFAPDKTPKYVYARFSQLVKCVPDLDPVCSIPPNDRVFKLTQDTIDPCYFKYMAADWMVWFHVSWGSPLRTRLDLWDTVGRVYFQGFEPPCAPEGTVFNNTVVCGPPGACAAGGIGTVTWRLESIALMNALNITTQYDLFMEMRPRDDGKKVYKYCKLKDATNIAILYEPD